MSEIHDECGVAAIYHLPGGEISPLCGEWHPWEVSRLLPRMLLDIQNRGPVGGRDDDVRPDPRPADRHAQGRRDGQRSVPPVASRQDANRSCRNTPGRPRSGTCGMPRAAGMTRAMPSRSSGTICGSTSGSVSRSTASWPTTRQLRDQLLGRWRASSGPRERHRDHHARDQPRAVV